MGDLVLAFFLPSLLIIFFFVTFQTLVHFGGDLEMRAGIKKEKGSFV